LAELNPIDFFKHLSSLNNLKRHLIYFIKFHFMQRLGCN
jgi:hypothetical protein